MEKIMNIWAKISSLVVIYWMIESIYLAIKIIISTGNISNWPTPILTPLLWILVEISSIGSIIIFYGPLFYYGWIKKSKNKKIKVIVEKWAKVLTILFPVFFIIGLISPWGLGLSDILFLASMLFVIIPLYYYAWRK